MIPQDFFIIASTDDDLQGNEEALAYIRRAEKIGYQISLQFRRTYVLTGKGTILAKKTPFGAIIGIAFGSGQSPCSTDQATSGNEGKFDDFLAMLEDMWGSYVAISDDPAENDVSLIRDPSGSLPCYRRRVGTKWTLISSRADHICRVAGTGFDLRWDVIVRMAQNPHVRTHQTAIEGVEELLPGWCLKVGSGLTD